MLQSMGSQRVRHDWATQLNWSNILACCLLNIYAEPVGASLVSQLVKNLPAMQEAQIGSLGWEDPLEKEVATHSSTFAWRIPWTEELDRLESMGWQRVGHDCAWLSLSHIHAEYMSKRLSWMNKKLKSRFLGKISITSDMQIMLL